jgi:hypothetical protein
MSGGAANAAVAAEKRMAAQKMSVAELRLALAQAGVDSRNALEKSELVNLYVSNMGGATVGEIQAPAGATTRQAAPRKATATPAQSFELPFKVPKEIWDHGEGPFPVPSLRHPFSGLTQTPCVHSRLSIQ